MPDSIVLLSGGIDSTTAAYLWKEEGHGLYSINVAYSQEADREAESSRKIAAAIGVKEHITVVLPFYKDLEKRYRPTVSRDTASAYIPARNIVFYGVAAAYAETLGASDIVFGSNADDAKVFPDARLQFAQSMNQLIRIGTRVGFEGKAPRIMTPLLNYSKLEVLRLALKLHVPLELTWSCHEENATVPCGICRGCHMRSEAFKELSVEDPGHCMQNSEANTPTPNQ